MHIPLMLIFNEGISSRLPSLRVMNHDNLKDNSEKLHSSEDYTLTCMTISPSITRAMPNETESDLLFLVVHQRQPEKLLLGKIPGKSQAFKRAYLFNSTINFKLSSQFGLRGIIILKKKIIKQKLFNTVQLTILATNRDLNASTVARELLWGSPEMSVNQQGRLLIKYNIHRAISCSSLYAICSAFSLLFLSFLSSLVSTLVGGGVSFGS